MRVLSALLAATALTPSAFAGEVRFETSLPAVQRGFLHPAVAVGFNPQPDPPRWRTDLDNLLAPVVTAVQAPAAHLDLRVGVTSPTGAAVESLIVPAEACGARRDVVLYPSVGEVALPPGPCSQGRVTLEAVFSDGSVMRFRLAIAAESAAWGDVSPGAIVGFNPQPDPPKEAMTFLTLRFPVEVTHVTVQLAGEDEAGKALRWQ